MFQKRWRVTKHPPPKKRRGDEIPKFFVRWHVDNSKFELPTTPAEIGKLFSAMLKMSKVDLHFGSFSDWGQFGNGMEGYALSELEDRVALAAVMLKYRPIITWEVYAVLNVDESKMLLEKGGRVRGITQISVTYLNVVRDLLDIGEDVRHVDQYRGEFMLVVDKRESISLVPQHTVDIADLSLDDRVVGFWSDDPSYADYLITTFEAAWKEAVDENKRIEELL